jgi:hypothetical protein
LAIEFLFEEIFLGLDVMNSTHSTSHFTNLPIRAQMEIHDALQPLISIVEEDTIELVVSWLTKVKH